MSPGGKSGTTGVHPAFASANIAGGAAGNHTVTGISGQRSLLALVIAIDHDPAGGGAGISTLAVTVITSEFTVSADNQINNTGGTDTTGMTLVILWTDNPTQ